MDVPNELYLPPSQNKRPILSSLLHSIIPTMGIKIRTSREHRKLLIHIPIQKRQQRNNRQRNIGHERGNDFRKGISDSKLIQVRAPIFSSSFCSSSCRTDIRPNATSRTLSLAAKFRKAFHPCLTCSPAVWPTRMRSSVLSSSPRILILKILSFCFEVYGWFGGFKSRGVIARVIAHCCQSCGRVWGGDSIPLGMRGWRCLSEPIDLFDLGCWSLDPRIGV